MEIKENFSLKNFNTFDIEVFTKYFVRFNTIEDLKNILVSNEFKNLPRLILGGGSNILFTQNFEGIVLKNEITGIQIVKENTDHVWVKSGAGEVWHDLVLYCIENNFGGIENLSLIPGTVGASPIQNIGAYGVEIKDSFQSLEAFNISTGLLEYFDNAMCEFNYRDSIFKRKYKGEFIITSVTFKLDKNPKLNISYGAIQDILKNNFISEPTIKSISQAIIQIRSSKLPNPKEIGNAGSFFKNPEIPTNLFNSLKMTNPAIPSYPTKIGLVKIPAGWLIEQCGWKGKVVGQTGVHKNQALVLVNYGNATGNEVQNLAKDIQKSVYENFKIHLEMEVNIV